MESSVQEVGLLNGQLQFLADRETPILCWIGGLGCGKTHALALWVLRECMDFPNNQLSVAAASMPQLRQSTIPTFLQVFDSLGIEYEYSEWKGTIKFANGSWFKFQSLDINEDELKGATLGGLAVDEVDACPEGHVKKLLGRLRRIGTSQQARLIGNSPPPNHWLEYAFIPQKAQSVKREVMGSLMQTGTRDNVLLSDKYLTMLETTYPPGTPEHRRYILGEMGVPLEGVVYKEFEGRHLITADQVPWDRVVGYINSLDFGDNHYTVFLSAAVDEDDNIYVIGEHAARRTLLKDHAAAIANLYKGGPIAADHDSQDRMELAELGIDTVPADKRDKSLGINLVRQRFRSDKLFIVEDACPHLLAELPYYVWADNKDEPVKQNDDACFTADTECLTEAGWKSLADVQLTDRVAAVSEDGVLSFELPSRVIHREYSGPGYTVNDHHNLNFTATADHRHAVSTQTDAKLKKVWRVGKLTVDELPAESYWQAIPAMIPSGSGVFESPAEAWMAGFWLAEGCFDTGSPTFIIFDQKKAENQNTWRAMAAELGWVWSETHSKASPGVIRFVASGQGERVVRWRSIFGEHSYGKRLSIETIMLMSAAEREAMWEGYMAGDGCRTGSGWHYDTVSKPLADGIQFLTATVGMAGNLYSYSDAGARRVMGRDCVCRKTYRGSVRKSRPVVNIKKSRIKPVEINETVHCVSTSTGMFFARNNGKTFVAGNCDALRYLVTLYDGRRDWLQEILNGETYGMADSD